ncbi:MAG: cyclodeaminase/cyclohydrolase family protein [Deltaproteobacteria bacterium]|jgi:formiminotetrahydrofolate cyclodeaminase|nr:cyclodeaminase/cyclohydrolase family protein [Deltaproteobacteria bacterium]
MFMPKLTYERPFSEILAVAASKSPTPGGGSVSAMAGALGASMGAMVANLTQNKVGYEEYWLEATEMATLFLEGIEDFKKLTYADMDAFANFMEALRLPKGTEEQKAARRLALDAASAQAALAPLEIAQKSFDLLLANNRLASYGNAAAVNDGAVAAIILEAALRAALLQVDVNLPSLADAELRQALKTKRDFLEERGRTLLQETVELVKSRAVGL